MRADRATDDQQSRFPGGGEQMKVRAQDRPKDLITLVQFYRETRASNIVPTPLTA